MDFLDPRTKSSRRRRLIVSYLLMGLLVTASASALIYSSFGYGINTKTRQIIQNGLVFVDSKPGGAEIFVNGKDLTQTTAGRPILPSPTRIVLPSGDYTLRLEKTGYRSWQDSFTLDTQSIIRLNYPLLLPVKLQPKTYLEFKTSPSFFTQSPNQRWLLAATISANRLNFTQIDTTRLTSPATLTSLPAADIKLKGGNWRVLAWSTDGSNLLLEHIVGSAKEFVVFNRSDPSKSFNLTDLIGRSVDKVVMRAGSPDQFYIYRSAGLSSFDVGSKRSELLLDRVLAFQAFGSNSIVYVTAEGAPSGGVLVNIWDGNKSYTLSKIVAGKNYLLAAGNYRDNDYYAAGVAGSGRVYIYKNPLGTLRSKASSPPAALASLSAKDAKQLNFSPDSQFVLASAGQNLAVYNLDSSHSTAYRLSQAIDGEVTWLPDGYHLSALTQRGRAFIADYNGANQQLLTNSVLPAGAFFDPNFKTMFTQTLGSGGAILSITSLRVD